MFLIKYKKNDKLKKRKWRHDHDRKEPDLIRLNMSEKETVKLGLVSSTSTF